MTPLFMIGFVVSFLVTLVVDVRLLRRVNRAMRLIYVGIGLATLGLFICEIADIPLYMPTTFLAYQVAPWVEALLKGR